jgi:hypothetical protein
MYATSAILGSRYERDGTMGNKGKIYNTRYGKVRVVRVKGGTVTLDSKGNVVSSNVKVSDGA